MANEKTITLVTGGSGYLAGWIIAHLLREGHTVRATLRNMDRAHAARADIASIVPDVSGLEFVVADLLADDGWDAAMAGVGQVAHVASPVMDRPGVDTIATAVEGTRRVLGAAEHAGVERIVVTSSAVAARPSDKATGTYDENDWTNAEAEETNVYSKSKTLAERAVWEFAREHPNAPKIATILPGFIQGPMLGKNASASLGVVGQMLQGYMTAAPRLGFAVVDVRDLADLHVRVLTDPAAMGERWIASSDFLWFGDMAAILREQFGEAAAKAPTEAMPDAVFREATLGTEMEPLAADLGVQSLFTSAKAERLLDWHPRPAREAVIATGQSMLA